MSRSMFTLIAFVLFIVATIDLVSTDIAVAWTLPLGLAFLALGTLERGPFNAP